MKWGKSLDIRTALHFSSKKIARYDAQVLLGHLLVKDRSWVLAHGDEQLGSNIQTTLESFVDRRASGEPLQYIIQRQEFFGIPLSVGPGVLIPRPETEHLVEAVLKWIAASGRHGLQIVDVGTGSGAIALALAKHLPDDRILAIDVSEEALKIARRNALQEGLDRVDFARADLLEGIFPGSVDIVVSNPPYVPCGDAVSMQREVVDHEPHEALFAGEDGLSIYRRLIPQAHDCLRPGGLLAMEIGWGQREGLTQLLAGWNELQFLNDYSRIPRVVLAER